MRSYGANIQKLEESYAHSLLPRRPQSSPAIFLRRSDAKSTTASGNLLYLSEMDATVDKQGSELSGKPSQMSLCHEYISAKSRVVRLKYSLAIRTPEIKQKQNLLNIKDDRSMHSVSGTLSPSSKTGLSHPTNLCVQKRSVPTQFPVYKKQEKDKSLPKTAAKLFQLHTEQAYTRRNDALKLIAFAGSDIGAQQNRFIKNMIESKNLIRRRNAAMLEVFQDDRSSEKQYAHNTLAQNVEINSIKSETTTSGASCVNSVLSAQQSQERSCADALPRDEFYAALEAVDSASAAIAAETARVKSERAALDAALLKKKKKKILSVSKRKDFDGNFYRKAEISAIAESVAGFKERGFETVEEYDVQLDDDVTLRAVRMVNMRSRPKPEDRSEK